MSRPFAYYTRFVPPGGSGPMKRCECGYVNVWRAKVCRNAGCDRRLRRRQRPKKDRSVDARLARESELLDQWLTKLALVATKVRYYRSRIRSLERERANQGRPRPRREKPPVRGIRIREEGQ